MSDRRAPMKAGKAELLESCEVVAEELEMALEGLKEFARPYLALMPRPEMREHGGEVMSNFRV
jgi:hypothetical protein